MRAKLQAMAESKPGLIPRLAAIGDRLGAEQMEIEAAALDLLSVHLSLDAYGAGRLDPAPLRTAPREVRAAALSFAILAVSGEAHAPALAAIPGAWARLEAKTCAVTLGGARIGRLGARHGHALLFTRDPGAAAGRAAPKPDLVLAPGQTGVFDGRFEISTGHRLPGPVRVRAVGPAGAKEVNQPARLKAAVKEAANHARPGLPAIFFANARNCATLPHFLSEDAPNMAEASDESRILARFLGKERLEAQSASVKAPQPGPV